MLEIRVSLDASQIDDSAELERLHRRLRTYLDGSGLERVRPVRPDTTEEGARGVGALVLGAFDAALPDAVKAAIPALARVLEAFTQRSRRSVYVEIRGEKLAIDKASAKDVEQLLHHFIAETTSLEER